VVITARILERAGRRAATPNLAPVRRIAATALLIAIAAAGTTGSAYGEGPTRAEYVTTVEAICERNTLDNDRILRNVRERIRQGKLGAAGSQFIRASEALGASTREIAAVPRPAVDDARLRKWFGFLDIIRKHLRNLGKALEERDRIKAAHERIRVERSGNAANNVGFVFEFRHCRFTPSRFL
jgi:hypothetical protein